MKLNLIVLIAAVTVNCLVTAISAKVTLTQPSNLLQPPFEDTQAEQQNSYNQKRAASTSYQQGQFSITTKSEKTNIQNNVVPQLSTDVLLPPLFDANYKEETQQGASSAYSPATLKPFVFTSTTATPRPFTTATTKKATFFNFFSSISTTVKPYTTKKIEVPTYRYTTQSTTRKPFTTKKIDFSSFKFTSRPFTTKKVELPKFTFTTTVRPFTTKKVAFPTYQFTTTTAKPFTTKKAIEPPALFVDALLPPLEDNSAQSSQQFPSTYQTTVKTNFVADTNVAGESKIQAANVYTQNQEQPSWLSSLINKSKSTSEQQKQQQPNSSFQFTTQKPQQQIYTTTKKPQQQLQPFVFQKQKLEDKYIAQQYNYNFASYFSSTTPKPPKNGLPTITPFPNHLSKK